MVRRGIPAPSWMVRQLRMLKMAPLPLSTTAPMASVMAKSPSERLSAFLVNVSGTT